MSGPGASVHGAADLRGDAVKQDATPTSRWLSTTADFMPVLAGPAGDAERLLLLVHYGIDWSGGWVSRYRSTYWESLLPDRVICATYRSGNLRRWWRDVADDLGSQPPNSSSCCARNLSQCSRSSALRPRHCC